MVRRSPLVERDRPRLAEAQVAQLAALLAGEGVRTLLLDTGRGRFAVRLAPVAGPLESVAGSPGTASGIVSAATVGEFLTAHPHRDAVLARPGERLAPGDLLGLIRIGALLTPVTFDGPGSDAVLDDVLADHGALVGYGTPLFRVTLR